MTAPATRRDLSDQVRLVAAGGVAGALLRFLISSGLPSAGTTLALNVIGSLLLGWLAARYRASHTWLAAGVGFCGALTTFSTFALDVAMWLDRGDVGDGLGLLAVTTLGAIGAAFTGFALGSRTIGRRT